MISNGLRSLIYPVLFMLMLACSGTKSGEQAVHYVQSETSFSPVSKTKHASTKHSHDEALEDEHDEVHVDEKKDLTKEIAHDHDADKEDQTQKEKHGPEQEHAKGDHEEDHAHEDSPKVDTQLLSEINTRLIQIQDQLRQNKPSDSHSPAEKENTEEQKKLVTRLAFQKLREKMGHKIMTITDEITATSKNNIWTVNIPYYKSRKETDSKEMAEFLCEKMDTEWVCSSQD